MAEDSESHKHERARQLLQQLVFLGRRMDRAAVASAFYAWRADLQRWKQQQLQRQLERQQQELHVFRRQAEAASGKLLSENRRLQSQIQQLQRQVAVAPSEAGTMRALAEFASELLHTAHTTSQQHQLSACKEMLLSIQVKNGRLVHYVDSFLSMIAMFLDPFVEGDLVNLGQPKKKASRSPPSDGAVAEGKQSSEEEEEEEETPKRIRLCMNMLGEQMDELLKAVERKMLAQQAIQQQPGAQPRGSRASHATSAPVEGNVKPFTWHSPKVLLEPKREICFPLPIPQEWSIGRNERVKLEWDVRVRQGTAMSSYTELSLQKIDEDAHYYSDESSDDEQEYTEHLHSRVEEEDELVDGCKPVHLRGFRFMRSGHNYRVRIRNTAFMAPIELSYKIVLMPDPDNALYREKDADDEEEAGAAGAGQISVSVEQMRPETEATEQEEAQEGEVPEDEPDPEQLAAVSVAYRRLEQANYQAELLTRTYLTLWTRWRRNRAIFRSTLVTLAQANKRLVTIQTYQAHVNNVDRLNALTSLIDAESSTPVQFEVQPEALSPLSQDVVYAAEGLKVGAGEDFRIRDGNVLDGSTLSWTFSVSPAGGDIGFCICVRHADGSLPPLVEYKRCVGGPENPVTGECIVEDVGSTDIEIIFDNSYSWINPKTLSYHITIKPPAVADTVTAEIQQAQVTPTSQHEASHAAHQETNDITPEQLQMEQAMAEEAILALTETVSMCTNEAEQIAQQIRGLLGHALEFWSIHGEIFYTYDAPASN